MVVIAFLTDPFVVSKILDHLKLLSSPPVIAPAGILEAEGEMFTDIGNVENSGLREFTRPFAVARAHRWLKLLDDGQFSSVTELAEAVGMDPSLARRHLNLTLLNTAMVQRVMDGTEPEGMSLETSIQGVPALWDAPPAIDSADVISRWSTDY